MVARRSRNGLDLTKAPWWCRMVSLASCCNQTNIHDKPQKTPPDNSLVSEPWKHMFRLYRNTLGCGKTITQVGVQKFAQAAGGESSQLISFFPRSCPNIFEIGCLCDSILGFVCAHLNLVAKLDLLCLKRSNTVSALVPLSFGLLRHESSQG
jgi:hypothetical protein